MCARARGRERDHARDKGGERRVPEYHFDYCFPGDEMGYKWTILAGRERASGSIMAHFYGHAISDPFQPTFKDIWGPPTPAGLS